MKYKNDENIAASHKILSAMAVVLILTGFMMVSVKSIGLKLDFSTLLQYKQRLWQGFLMTIVISIGSLIIIWSE